MVLDHFLTAEELKNVIKCQSLSDDEINLMITEADVDGDKQVNYKGKQVEVDFCWFILIYFLEFVQLIWRLDL